MALPDITDGQHRLRSLVLLGLASSAGVAVLLASGVAVEYLYTEHYFAIHYAWHTATFPWNGLNFAFFVRAGRPQAESTLLLAASCGVSGGLVWRWITQFEFSRGVADGLITTFCAAWLSSFVAWAATFSELLVLQSCQMLGIVVFCTVARTAKSALTPARDGRVRTRVRFSLRAMLTLPAIVAGMLAVAPLIDLHGVRAVLIAPFGRINVWLPLLGGAVALTTLLFAISYEAAGRKRVIGLTLSTIATATLGRGLATVYPQWPVLWSTYFGSYAPGTFQYVPQAYTLWLPLLGLFIITTLVTINAATRLLAHNAMTPPLAPDP